MKKRFENARAGDAVYCRLNGNGFIIGLSTNPTSKYPICVSFKDVINGRYTADGKFDSDHVEPTLFYRSETDNYLTERPFNWSDVKPGTICFAWDDGQQSPPNRVKFRFVADGKPWFEMTETILRTFKHAEVVCDV